MSVAPLALTLPNSLTTALRPWLATDGPSGLHAESRHSLLTIARRAQPPTVSSVSLSQRKGGAGCIVLSGLSSDRHA